jgi:GTP cyclohydrolase I
LNIYDLVESSFKERYKGWEGADQFSGTGDRLRRMIDELCWTQDKIDAELAKAFKAVYPHKFSEMLVAGPTSVWTFCPHHIVPCNFLVYVGYIPDGKILGLSKFSRVSLILGRRPIMQEQYNEEVAEAFMSNLKPKGVGIYIIGTHGCIGCRGVTQPEVKVTTDVLKGVFLTEPEVRQEFFHNIQSRQ